MAWLVAAAGRSQKSTNSSLAPTLDQSALARFALVAGLVYSVPDPPGTY